MHILPQITGNENIPVCLNCILSENFYHSLGILKQMLRDRKKLKHSIKLAKLYNIYSSKITVFEERCAFIMQQIAFAGYVK